MGSHRMPRNLRHSLDLAVLHAEQQHVPSDRLAFGEFGFLFGRLAPGKHRGRELADLGRRYLAALPAASRGRRRVTDKMPLNFRYLGLLQGILPGARIVHCRRDLRDVALSCFATDFIDPALGFATRIDWLADYLRFYEEVVTRWQDDLAVPVLELEYEALVRDPEPWIRRLVAFADLSWDEGCLSFHRQRRVATTASHAQVRQPIHTRSIGRWRHYRAHLGELGDLLTRR